MKVLSLAHTNTVVVDVQVYKPYVVGRNESKCYCVYMYTCILVYACVCVCVCVCIHVYVHVCISSIFCLYLGYTEPIAVEPCLYCFVLQPNLRRFKSLYCLKIEMILYLFFVGTKTGRSPGITTEEIQ